MAKIIKGKKGIALGAVLIVCAIVFGFLAYRAHIRATFTVIGDDGKAYSVTPEVMLKRCTNIKDLPQMAPLINQIKKDISKKRRMTFIFGLASALCGIGGGIFLSKK